MILFPFILFIYICGLLVMQGNILYRFPSLQRTASQKSKRKEYVGRRWADWVGVEKFFKEKKWQFRFFIVFFSDLLVVIYLRLNPNMDECSCSKTTASERAMVIGLGGLNLFGVIILGTMMKYALYTTYWLIFLLYCFISVSSLLFFIDPKRYGSYTW